MEEWLGFFALVIVISSSGVMAPGPLFTANIGYGLKGGAKAGLKMAVGHTLVELPLIVLLGIGVFSMEVFPEFQKIIAFFGALGLFAFGGLQIRSILKTRENSKIKSTNGPFFAGIILSGLNPFFLIWWFTIGFKLIADSLILWSFTGIFILFLMHIWMDYLWLGSTAFLAKKSAYILSKKYFKIFIIILSAILFYFGAVYLVESFS